MTFSDVEHQESPKNCSVLFRSSRQPGGQLQLHPCPATSISASRNVNADQLRAQIGSSGHLLKSGGLSDPLTHQIPSELLRTNNLQTGDANSSHGGTRGLIGTRESQRMMGYLGMGLRLSGLLVLLLSLRVLPISFMSQLLFVVLQDFEALHHAVSRQPGLRVVIPALHDGGAEDAQTLQEGSGSRQVLHPGLRLR